eukprot:EG_transcript_2432
MVRDHGTSQPPPDPPHQNAKLPSNAVCAKPEVDRKGQCLSCWDWWRGKSFRRVYKDLLYSLGVIVLYLAVIFLYSLAGGAALVALDAEATEAEGLRQLAEFEALGFNESQLAYLATLGIPSIRMNYTLLEGQFYASTLITTIGYGMMTSYSTPARWFAVVYSAVGIVMVAYLALKLRKLFLSLCISIGMLVMAVLLPVRFGPGRAVLLAAKVGPIFDELDEERVGFLNLWSIRLLLKRVQSELDDQSGVDKDAISWETVCAITLQACRATTGTLSKTQLAKAMEYYAVVLAEDREKRQISILIFQYIVLIAWVFGGAFFYSSVCPCMGYDLGVGVYFIVITLTTIGTGDVAPCTMDCQIFWFFHTIIGLSIMTAVIEVSAIHFSHLVEKARAQRMELSPHYSHEFHWGILALFAQRFSLAYNALKAVAIIMGYTFIGAMVFHAYEVDVVPGEVQDFQALVREQNFDDVQQAYLLRALKLTADWSILGAARYSLECICTLGYGNLAPRSTGGRTFLVFYIILGLGVVAFQLQKLGEVVQFMVHLCADALARVLPWRLQTHRHDRRLLRLLEEAMDACEGIVTSRNPLTLGEVKAHIVSLDNPAEADVKELLSWLVQGSKNMQIHPRDLSVNLAQAYHRLLVRKELLNFLGGLLTLAVLLVVSLPVYMAFESWTIGEAAWFMYITITGIGLGDYVLSNGTAIFYWFFFVLVTVGGGFLLINGAITLYRDMHMKFMIWFTLHWATGSDRTVRQDDSIYEPSSPALGFEDFSNITVTSQAGFLALSRLAGKGPTPGSAPSQSDCKPGLSAPNQAESLSQPQTPLQLTIHPASS